MTGQDCIARLEQEGQDADQLYQSQGPDIHAVPGADQVWQATLLLGREGQSQGEEVTEIPAGYTISESVNGVVSLVKDKDRPSLIQPEEVAAVEAAVRRHPKASRYRVVVKGKRIEVYERAGDDYETVVRDLGIPGLWRPGLTKELRDMQERYARYEPVLRFNLIDPAERWFGVERMCYRSSVDGWLELILAKGPVGELARELIPTLGTDQFFDLW